MAVIFRMLRRVIRLPWLLSGERRFTSMSKMNVLKMVSVMIFVSTFAAQSATLNSHRNYEDEIATIELFETLLENYNTESRPYFGNTPVVVTVDIYLSSLDAISEMNMDFSITIYMRQRWHDPRLAYNSSAMLPPTSDLVDKIWLPDLIIGNAKVARLHNITTANKWVQIYESGHVICTTRLSLVLSCPMNFHYFPLDNQECEMEIESFQNTIDDVYYKWNEEGPIEYHKYLLRLPQYRMEGVQVSNNCTKRLKTGVYSCIRMVFYFHRLIGYYMLQAYIPSIMLIGTSWVSFWLPIQGIPARVALGVMTALSTITLYNGVRDDISHVSYIKALDVWFGVCLGFVVCALLEYACVHYLSFNKLGIPVPFLSVKSSNAKKNEHCFVMTIANFQEGICTPTNNGINTSDGAIPQCRTTDHKAGDGRDEEDAAGAYTNSVDCLEEESKPISAKTKDLPHNNKDYLSNNDFPKILCVKGNCDSKGKGQDILYDTGTKIDHLCRLIYPVAFLLFNAGYWGYYQKKEQHPTHGFNGY